MCPAAWLMQPGSIPCSQHSVSYIQRLYICPSTTHVLSHLVSVCYGGETCLDVEEMNVASWWKGCEALRRNVDAGCPSHGLWLTACSHARGSPEGGVETGLQPG